MTSKNYKDSSDKQKVKAPSANQYYESFYEKIRDQFDVPASISDQKLLDHIEENFPSDDKEDEEAFKKAGTMDDLLERKRRIEDMVTRNITEEADRERMLKGIDRKLKPLQDYFDVNAADANQLSIDKLTVCAESNEEIGIKKPGKKKILFNNEHAGFTRSSSKEWVCLIEILENHPHIFHLGKSKDKAYDRRRARLSYINKKLVFLIKKNFPNVAIPADGKLYEKCKGEGTGKQKFKFQIESVFSEDESLDGLRKKYEKETDEDLLSLLKEYSEEFGKNPQANYLKNKNEVIINVLMERGHNKEEISDIILGKTNKELISEEFSNFEESYEEERNKEIKSPEGNLEKSE